MKQILLIFIFAFLGSLSFAQPFGWVAQIGGTDQDFGHDVAVDALGNVYTTGYFSDTTDFDPSLGTYSLISNSPEIMDAFIEKLDMNGNLVWVKQVGGIDVDMGYKILLDSLGNIYVLGIFNNTVDFDPSAGVFNLYSSTIGIFMLKLDASGNFVWAKHVADIGVNYVETSFALDSLGNLYLTGSFMGTVDVDPSASVYNLTAVNASTFVLKLDNGGNFVWAKQLNSNNTARSTRIALDNVGDIYVDGYFEGMADFDPGAGVFSLNSQGDRDIYVVKLDGAGNFVWAKQMGGTNAESALCLEIDGFNNIYIGGTFNGTVDFDPNAGVMDLTASAQDLFICKLDPLGNLLWAKQIGSSGYEAVTDIYIDDWGDVYATGSFEDFVDFDPGIGFFNLYTWGMGIFNTFVCKLDPLGNFISAFQFQGDHSEGYSITGDAVGNLYITGCMFWWAGGGTDSDPSPTSATILYTVQDPFEGAYDGYVCKIGNACLPSNSTVNQIACNSFTFNGQTYNTSGIYSHTFTSIGGCDSVVNLNLTIITASNTTVSQSACNTYTFGGQTYTSSGAYTHTFTNAGGCDSIVTVNLTISNSTSGSTNQTACDAYTLNGQTYTSSGIYTQMLTNAGGCDSTLTLNLTLQSTHDSMDITACKFYILKSQVYITDGVYTQNFTNVSGCDSSITVDLTIINALDSTVTQNGIVLTANAINVNYQWIDCNSNTLISGATNQTFTPTINGNYAVIVTETNCSDTSACYIVTGLGVEDGGIGRKMIVYPNPSEELIMIDLGDMHESIEVSVYDLVGQVISSRRYERGKVLEVEMPVVSGVYFVSVSFEGRQEVTVKVVRK